MPASTSGPTGWSVSSSAVTTPKFPPPPRRAHSSSGCSVADARTRSPSAVISSAASRLSHASPCLRSSQPEPPPIVRPATPVVETRPPVVARPCSCVARSTCAHVAPPPTRAIRATGSTVTSSIPRTSRTRPSSRRDRPATEWPPARTATDRSWSRAKARAAMTSSGAAHRATRRGRVRTMALNSTHASSNSGAPGPYRPPRRRKRSSSAEVRIVMGAKLGGAAGGLFADSGHLASEQAEPRGVADGRGARGQRELRAHVGDVAVHGVRADDEPARDLGVGQALGHEAQDLDLAPRELARRRRRASGRGGRARRRGGPIRVARRAEGEEGVAGGTRLGRRGAPAPEGGQDAGQDRARLRGLVGSGAQREAVRGVLAGAARLLQVAARGLQLGHDERRAAAEVRRPELGGAADERGARLRRAGEVAEPHAGPDEQLLRGDA